MKSVAKWGRNGAIAGAILGVIGAVGGNGLSGIFADFGGFIVTLVMFSGIGCIAGVSLRKWLFRTFWQ